ncbi:RDD family protein [Labilibacter marinus]|uniref:RDD family protein n=1 Tax=Labilibacter marinus TaxID=1477105 RepID=UPI0008353158|nr:RDD family protein [Labilibacter marinus]
MEFVNVSTTQNIDLEYRIAGVGDRILAFLFDSLVTTAWSIIWIVILQQSGDLQLWHSIFTIPVVFYTLLSEVFMNGQTFGKMVLKIKVAKLDGSELTLGTCLIRWVMRIIDIYLFFGPVAIISIISSKKSQRLGDLATDTTVVKVSSKNLFEDTNYVEVPDDYTPVYVQSSNLSDEDATTINEVLNFVNSQNDTGTDIAYHPMQVKLQNALKKKLGITEINGSAKQFLQDLLKDFNYMHR